MWRLFEFVVYGAASLAVGWFSPRVFLHEKWNLRTRWLFTGIVTLLIFLLLGYFRLATGEDLGDAVADHILCPVFPLAHCPDPAEKPDTNGRGPNSALPEGLADRLQGVAVPPSAGTRPLSPPAATGGSPAAVAPPPETSAGQQTPDQSEANRQSDAAGPAPPRDAPPPAQAAPENPADLAPPAAKPRSPERFGISIVLDGLNETNDRYIATLRFVNSGSSDAEIALLSSQWSYADFFLTDSNGGSCQMAANGEGWGSLSAIIRGSFNIGASYALIPANGEARHFIFFNKMRCAEKLGATAGISLNGTFILKDGSEIPVSFSDLTMTSR